MGKSRKKSSCKNLAIIYPDGWFTTMMQGFLLGILKLKYLREAEDVYVSRVYNLTNILRRKEALSWRVTGSYYQTGC